MKQLILALFLSYSSQAEFLPAPYRGQAIKIAVIDTGYTAPSESNKIPLCDDGHADTTSGKLELVKNPPVDRHGHGTNIAHIISKFAGSVPHCLIILKFYDQKKTFSPLATAVAIELAISLKVDIINFSGGGYSEIQQESAAVKKALDKGIFFVAAAGNKGVEITPGGKQFYPASSDPRVIVVGALSKDGKRKLKSSNRGHSLDVWEVGEDVEGGGVTLTGTSQATAITTGKIVRSVLSKKFNQNRRANERQ